MRGRIVLSVMGLLMGAALISGLAVFGVPPLFASAWLLLLLAVGIVTRQELLDTDEPWPPPKPQPAIRGSDVSRLAWTINPRTGLVSPALTRRLDAALRTRLALHGLDLDDPTQHEAIDALVGGSIRTALQQQAVTRTDVERVLDAIESIPLREQR